MVPGTTGRTDADGVAFAYDGNGNPTLYNTAQAYDVEGRLASVAGAGGAVALTMGYRPDGLRAWKQDASGNRTCYLYDEDGNPAVETDAQGNVVRANVFAPDGLVARGAGSSSNYRQYLFDLQGSVCQRLDSGGNVLSAASFNAWGRGANGDPSDPFAYNGRWGYYRDAETEDYLCGERYYDPLGRWLTRDPIGVAGGINLYGYCAGGPVGNADPSGLDADEALGPIKTGISRRLLPPGTVKRYKQNKGWKNKIHQEIGRDKKSRGTGKDGRKNEDLDEDEIIEIVRRELPRDLKEEQDEIDKERKREYDNTGWGSDDEGWIYHHGRRVGRFPRFNAPFFCPFPGLPVPIPVAI